MQFIYYIYLNIRNNFKKQNFIFNEDIISWKYINDFYDFYIKNEVRFAPKLTDDKMYLQFNKKNES